MLADRGAFLWQMETQIRQLHAGGPVKKKHEHIDIRQFWKGLTHAERQMRTIIAERLVQAFMDIRPEDSKSAFVAWGDFVRLDVLPQFKDKELAAKLLACPHPEATLRFLPGLLVTTVQRGDHAYMDFGKRFGGTKVHQVLSQAKGRQPGALAAWRKAKRKAMAIRGRLLGVAHGRAGAATWTDAKAVSFAGVVSLAKEGKRIAQDELHVSEGDIDAMTPEELAALSGEHHCSKSGFALGDAAGISLKDSAAAMRYLRAVAFFTMHLMPAGARYRAGRACH